MKKGRPTKNEDGAIYYDKSRDTWRCWYYIVNPNTLEKQRKIYYKWRIFKMAEKTTKKTTSNPLYNITGCKKAKNSDRINIGLITGDGDKKKFATITIPIGVTGKACRISKVTDDEVILRICRKDIGTDNAEDEEE